MNERLGRGLEALIRDIDLPQPSDAGITTLPLAQIAPNRYQPRKQFDADKLSELAASIRENGIIQPIVVTKTEASGYELVAGERRLEAARLAGLSEVPVIIRSVSAREQLQLAIIENIQRENLNPIEEANAYRQLTEDFELTHAQISQIMGRERSTITNLLRLLKLPEAVQTLIIAGALSAGHARAVLMVEAPLQEAFAQYIVDHALSVRQAELRAKHFALPSANSKKQSKTQYISALEQQLSTILQSKTRIRDKDGKGKIVITYNSATELNTLTKKLSK